MNANPQQPEGLRLPGICASDRLFSAFLPVSTLVRELTVHPIELGNDGAHADVKELRDKIQRSLSGAKARNVVEYGNYLKDFVVTGNGFAPPIILWHPECPSAVEEGQGHSLVIPSGLRFIPVDGETQLAAWHTLSKDRELDHLVNVSFLLNCSEEMAIQHYHDINVYRVRPCRNQAVSRDRRSKATQVAHRLVDDIPFFQEQVLFDAPTLPKNDADHSLLFATLVDACFASLEGESPFGKQVAVRGNVPEATYEKIKAWWTQVTGSLGASIQNGTSLVTGKPILLAAIGKLGSQAMATEQDWEQEMRLKLEKLADIRWEFRHWDGICGDLDGEKFRVKRSRDAFDMVFKALAEPESDEGEKVRPEVQARQAA